MHTEPRPKRKSNPQGVLQVKKDALWKPLLRQFRRFIKQEALRNYVGCSRASMGGYKPEGCESESCDSEDEQGPSLAASLDSEQ